jgi:hypothetical protein
VQEYVVWQIEDNELSWFALESDNYALLHADDDGLLESCAFPGLRLDAEALRQRDLAAVLETVRNGTETDGHDAFVERLRQKHSA